MDIDPEYIVYIVTLILGVVATIFGKKWSTAKNLFAQGQNTSMKFALALQELSLAIEDDRITQEEAERIVARWKEVIDEANNLRNGTSITTKKIKIASTPNRLDSIEKKLDYLLSNIELEP